MTKPPGPLNEVRFLTVAEVARAARLSRMTVYRMVESGDLPAVRVGRSIRIPEQAARDWLHALSVATRPDPTGA